ncbi:MAG TPA: threonine ammonia-lyase [Polyangiaceae bacterium]|nr:threonine ammonia-lyase [Polyangiaceae bacterium]
MSVTLAAIEAAAARIAGKVDISPCAESSSLSELTGTRLCLKLENLQRTGSFKERGAANLLEQLSEEERARGVVTASAGNHAQAVALHAARLGIVATVVMPETTPLVKIQSTRRFGARVELYGRAYDEAAQRAAELASAENLVYVHPFDDERVMAGQGTLGLELLAQCPDLEAVVVPVGGGGLLAGVACAIKEQRPDVRVYGVEAQAFPSMKWAVESEAPPSLPGGKTIADGIAVRRIGKLTLPLVKRYVDELVLVDEEEIAEAILLLFEQEKTVSEGAGAVGLAALVHQRLPVKGKRVALVLSGGNIDVNLMARIIDRGLVKTGRLARFELSVPDEAGTLARIAQAVAATRANILEINHDRTFSGGELGETTIELVLETFGFDHVDEVRASLSAAGYRVRVSRPTYDTPSFRP